MATKILRRLLLLENDADDAELLRRRVCKQWPTCEIALARTKEEYLAKLKEGFDLILSDYMIPGYSGPEALKRAREQWPDIPFLFVSGAIVDEVAIESLKAGATDYLLKDRLMRLGPAIQRALNEAEAARQRKLVSERLRRSEEQYRVLYQDLLRQNEEIRNFYHTLSHELKTPLTSAREFISIVMDGLAGPVNQTQLEYLRIARESCDQLRVCINDLLDTTRLETGKLTLERKLVSVAELMQRMVTVFQHKAAEKELTLRQELQPDLPVVPMDERRITQVITNLLNNAIKYTPPGGEVVLSAHEAPGNPDMLQVSVRDTGCGIAKEEQERIFERLYQVKTGDASTENGIGLGLYLCRELVKLHGGTIRVESEVGKGCTFSFVLPKSQQSLHSNLLVIDDDPATLEMLQLLLTGEQYNVRTARDGAEALEEMRRQTPDVVVLDLKMPRLSGPETLREMRKCWGSIPVIVHTGFADTELMKDALAFSPFTLLAKPSSPVQILETIRKVERAADTAIWKRTHGELPKPH
jgi:two-component system sensor histidine kinase EvgS